MYYELYIDVLFLENLMMDSLLLLAVNRVLRCDQAYGRIFLGGALGSALTCLVIAVPMPAFIKTLLFHIIINSLMLAAGLKLRKIREFAKAFVLLYLCAVFMGGVMQFFRPYMRYVSLFYAAAAVSYLVFARMWKVFFASALRQRTLCKVTLYAGGEQGEVDALWDTGNVLSDPLTGEAVNIVEAELIQNMFGRAEEQKGFRYIPYRCVGGESVMKVFRIDKMCVHMGGGRWVEHPLIGLGENKLCESGEYQMILNREYLND